MLDTPRQQLSQASVCLETMQKNMIYDGRAGPDVSHGDGRARFDANLPSAFSLSYLTHDLLGLSSHQAEIVGFIC
jgi:hypothetical protein